MAVIETKMYYSTPIWSTLFEVVFCLVERVIEEINMMVQGFRVRFRVQYSFMERKVKKQRKKKEILNKFYPICPLTYSYQIGALSSVTGFCNVYE
jgi:hypothetical protein